MIHLNNVLKEFNNHLVFGDVNLSLPDSGIVALIGPNGAGKTTLLKCISGIEAITNGQIFYDDKHIKTTRDTFHSVSYFLENDVLRPELKGKDHLLLLSQGQRRLANSYQ